MKQEKMFYGLNALFGCVMGNIICTFIKNGDYIHAIIAVIAFAIFLIKMNLLGK